MLSSNCFLAGSGEGVDVGVTTKAAEVWVAVATNAVDVAVGGGVGEFVASSILIIADVELGTKFMGVGLEQETMKNRNAKNVQ